MYILANLAKIKENNQKLKQKQIKIKNKMEKKNKVLQTLVKQKKPVKKMYKNTTKRQLKK